jgi:eukaryotic-like serine/threonine-protein kinase
MERPSRVSELPQPDERWLDRYEIRRELGRGGFGRVYLAYDLRLDREVAIKVLQQADDLTEMDYQRFRREINIAAGLSHPGVVTVYDGGDHEGLSYLVMRYVEGRDLRHELRSGPLPTTRLLSVIDQIASALDYAHGRGLVHRDVKPANILCEAGSDRVYLADFGISRWVDQSTRSR